MVKWHSHVRATARMLLYPPLIITTTTTSPDYL